MRVRDEYALGMKRWERVIDWRWWGGQEVCGAEVGVVSLRRRRAARRSSAHRARRILRGIALHADLLAEGLALRGAVAIANQHLLAVLVLRHKLVPCWLHGFAVASPAGRRS